MRNEGLTSEKVAAPNPFGACEELRLVLYGPSGAKARAGKNL